MHVEGDLQWVSRYHHAFKTGSLFHTPLDDNSDALGTSHRSLLVERQADPGDIEILADHAADLFGKGFHELELAGFDELDQPFCNGLVIEGVVDVVRRCSPGDIGSHLDIEYDRLPDLAFPLINSDDGIDPELFQEYNVHLYIMRYVLRPRQHTETGRKRQPDKPMVFGFGKKKQPDDTGPDVVQEAEQSASGQPEEAPKQGMLARLREKLGRTRSNLTDGLANLLLGRKQIDDDLLEELETLLLTADVGIEATQRIIVDITAKVKRKELSDP